MLIVQHFLYFTQDPSSRIIGENVNILRMLRDEINQQLVIYASVHAAKQDGFRIRNGMQGLDGSARNGRNRIIVEANIILGSDILKSVRKAYKALNRTLYAVRVAAIYFSCNLINKGRIIAVMIAQNGELKVHRICAVNRMHPCAGLRHRNALSHEEIILRLLIGCDMRFGSVILIYRFVIIQMLLEKAKKYRNARRHIRMRQLVAAHLKYHDGIGRYLFKIIKAGLSDISQKNCFFAAACQHMIEHCARRTLSLGSGNSYNIIPKRTKEYFCLGYVLWMILLHHNSRALYYVVIKIFFNSFASAFIYFNACRLAASCKEMLGGLAFAAKAPDQYFFAFKFVCNAHENAPANAP